MTLTTRLTAKVDVTESMALDLATPQARHILEVTKTLASGTGSEQADLVWSDERTLAAGTSEDLDLFGALQPAIGGGTVDFARIKILMIFNTSDADQLDIGGHATAPWFGFVAAAGDKVIVSPGGVFLWYSPNGSTVTNGTADMLTITNPGTSAVTYKIIIVGASA